MVGAGNRHGARIAAGRRRRVKRTMASPVVIEVMQCRCGGRRKTRPRQQETRQPPQSPPPKHQHDRIPKHRKRKHPGPRSQQCLVYSNLQACASEKASGYSPRLRPHLTRSVDARLFSANLRGLIHEFFQTPDAHEANMLQACRRIRAQSARQHTTPRKPLQQSHGTSRRSFLFFSLFRLSQANEHAV